MRFRLAVTVFLPLVLMVFAFCVVAAAVDYAELGHFWNILGEVARAVGIPGVLAAAILAPLLAAILSRVERRFPRFTPLPTALVGASAGLVVSAVYSTTVWSLSVPEYLYFTVIGGLGGATFAWLHRLTRHSAA